MAMDHFRNFDQQSGECRDVNSSSDLDGATRLKNKSAEVQWFGGTMKHNGFESTIWWSMKVDHWLIGALEHVNTFYIFFLWLSIYWE